MKARPIKSIVRKRIDRARLMEANRRLKASEERLAFVQAYCKSTETVDLEKMFGPFSPGATAHNEGRKNG